MVSLDRFDVFRAVVEAGSFTGAANVLNQARAAVSFHVKQLEAELGVTLLTRTTRRVELTEAGERFYERCLRVLAEAEEAIDDARAEHGGMQGSLRVTSTVEYALRIVAPALSEFMSAHPALRVRLETHTSQADLVRDRFDVAIRLGRLEQFRDLPYRGVCIDTYDVRPVASPALLAAHGVARIDFAGGARAPAATRAQSAVAGRVVAAARSRRARTRVSARGEAASDRGQRVGAARVRAAGRWRRAAARVARAR